MPFERALSPVDLAAKLRTLSDDSRIPSPTNTFLSGASDRPRRDGEFYLLDLIFLVDGELFKVPRYAFEDGSEVFRDMFLMPSPRAAPHDGTDDEHPLRLDGVKASDFRELLRTLFPRPHTSTAPRSIDQWTAVLRLATMWEFQSVREEAIKAIGLFPLDAVDKLVLARDHEIAEWRLSSLLDLVEREEPMSMREFERLGAEMVLKIGRVRESMLRQRAGRGLSPVPHPASNTRYCRCAMTAVASSFNPSYCSTCHCLIAPWPTAYRSATLIADLRQEFGTFLTD